MAAATLNGGFGSVDMKARLDSPRQLHTPGQTFPFPPPVAPAAVISAQLNSFEAPNSPQSST